MQTQSRTAASRRRDHPPSRTSARESSRSAVSSVALIGAALAVKAVYDKHKLNGTLRLYGTPAEETLIGKVYMTLDGQFNELDACLGRRRIRPCSEPPG